MIPVSRPSLGERERELVTRCIDENRLTMGPAVEEFEEKFARWLGVREAIACSNGTTALHLALLACGISGESDNVLVPDLTYIASANAVAYTNARVRLVDIDPLSWCIDPEAVWQEVTESTRALIAVHLYGNACDMSRLMRFADKMGLRLIEDAAEGLGGHYRGRPLGTIGHIGTFSFYGNKIITTGEGGMVVTNDPVLAKRVRLFRGQGQHPERRYFHPVLGYNYRMTELQASLGIAQLERLDAMLARRRRIFEIYRDLLAGEGHCVGMDAAPWLFTLVFPDRVSRDELMHHLEEHGIESRPTFVPLHRQPMYATEDDLFPIACEVGDHGLSLPTFPDMDDVLVEHVASRVLAFLEQTADRRQVCG